VCLVDLEDLGGLGTEGDIASTNTVLGRRCGPGGWTSGKRRRNEPGSVSASVFPPVMPVLWPG